MIDPCLRIRVYYCLAQFRAMGATAEQILVERTKLQLDPEYLAEWLDTLGYCTEVTDALD